MLGFFGWIRSGVRNAVLAGLGDAAAELDIPDGEADKVIARLRGVTQLALPAPADDAPATRGRKKAAE